MVRECKYSDSPAEEKKQREAVIAYVPGTGGTVLLKNSSKHVKTEINGACRETKVLELPQTVPNG